MWANLAMTSLQLASESAALTDTERALAVALIAALATLLAAVIAASVAYFSSKRDRRRVLYSEATKAALGWKEMLYRVRRRQAGDDAAYALVARFHETQDSLTYYSTWVASDSKHMARSYRRLVERVKRSTEELIREAWNGPIRPVPGDSLPGDIHPDVDKWAEEFLRDVRSHLSWQPWRKFAVVKRNTTRRDANARGETQ